MALVLTEPEQCPDCESTKFEAILVHDKVAIDVNGFVRLRDFNLDSVLKFEVVCAACGAFRYEVVDFDKPVFLEGRIRLLEVRKGA